MPPTMGVIDTDHKRVVPTTFGLGAGTCNRGIVKALDSDSDRAYSSFGTRVSAWWVPKKERKKTDSALESG